MFVSIDTEGKEFDGIMRCISVSYGREDGVSDSITAYPGEWLTGQEVLMWLIEEVTGRFTDADGKDWKPAHVSFHFGYDIATLAKDFNEDLSIIYKATARKRDLLCNTHHTANDKICLKLHRYNEKSQQLNITEGGEGDLLTFDTHSSLGIATSPKRRMYVEYRPMGDRMEGNRRLDIHDTGTAFTGGLEVALSEWQPTLSDAELAAIAWGKQARKDGFAGATNEQIEKYSEAECVGHARMCRKLIDSIADAGHIPMEPSQLFGSGSIASAALDYYGVATRKQSIVCDAPVRDLTIDQLPTMTYFGGLIETPVLGQLSMAVDEADINSAYPSHMLSLPCMREGHGRWVSKPGAKLREVPSGSLGYVLASWVVETESTPPFLVRTKEGLVRQPLIGAKIWVSLPEYEAAIEQFGNKVTAHHVAFYTQECECANPLLFLSELYDKRAAIKKEMKPLEKADGSHTTDSAWLLLYCFQLAIKLVINSIYGKFAQRRPQLGRFTNMHYASHITGCTRAQVRKESWLREKQGGTIVYTHTDSVLSIRGNPSDGGNALGAWGLEKQSLGFTVIQPGLAVAIERGKIASRGCGAKEFRDGVERWLPIVDLTKHPHTWPALEIKRTFMLGRRLAIHEGVPHLAGNFVRRDFKPGFTSEKRNLDAAIPLPGNPYAWQIPPCRVVYDDEIARYEDIKSFETELSRRLERGEFDDL